MINKIKQAQKESRILPDVVVDYDNVIDISPIELINQIYPDFKKITNGSTIKYKALNTETNASKTIEIKHEIDFEPDYYIVKLSTHDGTLYFTNELYKDIIAGIVNGLAYCKSNNPYNYSADFWDYDINYMLGNVYHFRDFGMKDINGHIMHGQTDIMVMPVKVEYIRNNDGIYQCG